MRTSVCALALCAALVTSGRGQAPVGPVPPKPPNPPSIEALQKLIDAVDTPAAAAAWSAMTVGDRQRIYDELRSSMDQLKTGMGLPVGPPGPVAPASADPEKAPPPPTRKELDAVLTELSGVLDAGRKKSLSFAPAETVRLQQILIRLQKPPA